MRRIWKTAASGPTLGGALLGGDFHGAGIRDHGDAGVLRMAREQQVLDTLDNREIRDASGRTLRQRVRTRKRGHCSQGRTRSSSMFYASRWERVSGLSRITTALSRIAPAQDNCCAGESRLSRVPIVCCAEHDPAECRRALIAAFMKGAGSTVHHLRAAPMMICRPPGTVATRRSR